MRKYFWIIWILPVVLLSCGVSPKPIKLPCALNDSEFYRRVQDSLHAYNFQILSVDSTEITTIRKVDDGMSNRTVYLTLAQDSTSVSPDEWYMVVRIIVAYHGEVNEFYIDEQPRLTNDFRRDFKPVLTAIRSMCAPPPKKKKKVSK